MTYHEKITDVYQRISPYIKKTPLLMSSHFSQKTGSTVFFKCENLQYTHAFKVRGAFSKITNMPDKNKTIITASAGNHGLAVAYAAKQFGMRAIVVLPEFVPPYRAEMIRAQGAEVILYGQTMDDLNAKVAEYTKNPDVVYIHPFDDGDVIAGQATIAYEILNDVPDMDVIVAPIGGGGLISGIAQYAKSFNPVIRVYGSETLGADAMAKSLAAGKIVALSKVTSIAISLGATKVAERTFEIVKKYVDRVLTVSDEDAVRELRAILADDKLFVEPASSCALSAVMSGNLPDLKGKKIAVVLSGGNISLEQLKGFL
ncbi:MAG TPA: threonine/serine dehydratase [Gammaproteobacteria bacterium]|nr:threonine/serine dehydratase [Gammaproteobacteria bacterium]